MFGLNLAQKNNKSNEIQNKNTKIYFFLTSIGIFLVFKFISNSIKYV